MRADKRFFLEYSDAKGLRILDSQFIFLKTVYYGNILNKAIKSLESKQNIVIMCWKHCTIYFKVLKRSIFWYSNEYCFCNKLKN